MPQLDPSSYPSQIFWLIVCFFSMLFIMSKFIIPRIADIMEQRRQKIDGSLDQARALKDQAEAAMRKYRQAIDDATAKADKSMEKAQEEMKKFIEAKNNEIAERLADKVSQGEKEILHAKEQALKDVRNNAGELSWAVLQKVGITSISARDIGGAIKKVS